MKSSESLLPQSDSTKACNDAAANDRSPPSRNQMLTVPNVICVARLVGALSMLGIAVAGHSTAFIVLFVVLSLSDWIDGKLARWLNQRTEFGARLDSFADSVLYGSLFIGAIYLKWEVLQRELIWIGLAFGSYALTTGYGLWKFEKVPSYHTRGAKITQWLVLFGAVGLLMEWAVWPLRIAAIAGVLTNLEATAITYVLDEW